MGLKVDGIAASQAIDTSAESIDIEGLDISSLENGEGTFNYEHRHPKDEGASALDVLGAITFAKKIMKESDCSNERERMYWKQVEMPFVYVQGELFNDEEDDHVAAQAMAAAVQFYKRRGLPIVVRFSIDGNTLERDKDQPNVLKRAIARDVAMTFKPANHSCRTDVIDTLKSSKAELEKRSGGDDPYYYKANGLYRMPGVQFAMLPDGEDPVDFLKSEVQALQKALFAGNGNVAPSALTGGAAIMASDVAKKDVKLFTNRVKGAFRDWNGKSNLKTHMKKHVPEATDAFLDKFSDLVDTIHLRKAIELHNHLESVMKGGQLDSAIAKLPKTPEQENDVKTNAGVAPPKSSGNTNVGKMDTGKTGNFVGGGKPPASTGMPESNVGPKPPSNSPAGNPDEHFQNKMAQEGWKMTMTPGGWTMNHPNAAQPKAYPPGMGPGLTGGTGTPPATASTPSASAPLMQSKGPLGSAMQNFVQKFFPKPTAEPKQPTHMGKLANEGWGVTNHGGGNWTATAPTVTWNGMAKSEQVLATVGGKYVEPTAVTNPFFDDLKGKLYIPQGAFSFMVPSQESPESYQAFQTAYNSPMLDSFYDRVMDGWKLVNDRFKEGDLPDVIVKIASWLMHKPLQVPDSLREWVGSMSQLNQIPQMFNVEHYSNLKQSASMQKLGKDILQDLTNGGQQSLSTANARLGMNVLGAGDVAFGDDHLVRSMFGLDHAKDGETLKAIKSATANPFIWQDLEDYYRQHHDAVRLTKEGKDAVVFQKSPKDVLFPAVAKHWLSIPGHDKALGRSEAPGFQIRVDNSHTNLIKTEALQDAAPYVSLMNSWLAKYGPMMMLLMYFAILVPKILNDYPRVISDDPNGGLVK